MPAAWPVHGALERPRRRPQLLRRWTMRRCNAFSSFPPTRTITARSGLLRCNTRELAGRGHFAAQPFRRNVEAVRPGRRTEFEKHARKIRLVPQGFEHGTGVVDHRG